MSSQRQNKKKQSGGDAYHHALAVYGDASHQHAQSGSNVIASNSGPTTGGGAFALTPATISGPAVLAKGGSRRRHNKKSKKSKTRRSRRHRKTMKSRR